MAKMTKAERQQVETDLATLRRAVAQCEQELKDDDEADKVASGAAFNEGVAKIAKDHGTTAGFLAARMNPRRGGPQS
jgi:type II secretory pathway component PulM